MLCMEIRANEALVVPARGRKGPLPMNGKWPCLTLCLRLLLAAPTRWAQGPPYQADDPVPVDLHHYEFYIFGAADGTPAQTDSTGPALEFNWAATPRVQLHAILPWGSLNPSNNPVYLPGGTGPSACGLTDMGLRAKIAVIKETKYIPQIGAFTMSEIPTDGYVKGLGVGTVWYRFRSGCKQIWGTGSLTVALEKPSSRKPDTATSRMVSSC